MGRLLSGVLAFEGACMTVLIAVRPMLDIPTDVLSANPTDAILGATWLLALALVIWLTATTIASVLARLAGIPSAIRAVDWCTLPAIRRLAERATALSIVASNLASPVPVSASEAPPIPVVVVAETTTTSPAPLLTPESSPRLAPTPVPDIPPRIGSDVVPTPTAVGQIGFVESGPTRYVVQPGDNMWTITAAYLETELGVRPSNVRVSETWRVVMDLNRAGIRSGNVDLIFPGEELVLPPVER